MTDSDSEMLLYVKMVLLFPCLGVSDLAETL